MKLTLSIALAASLLFSGCAAFRHSAAWDVVMSSRSHGVDTGDGKDSYINRLHQALSAAGVEHKIVTYSYHFRNAYNEESVDTGIGIVYRDEATPNYPWWIADETHHLPVWLPNWDLDGQLAFFLQRKAEVIAVKNYPGNGAVLSTRATGVAGKPQVPLARNTPKPRTNRSVFAVGITRSHSPRAAKPPVKVQPSSDPLTPRLFGNRGTPAAGATKSNDIAMFRTRHGSDFDPSSSIDRQKMNDLRRQLLNRNQKVRLRPEA